MSCRCLHRRWRNWPPHAAVRSGCCRTTARPPSAARRRAPSPYFPCTHSLRAGTRRRRHRPGAHHLRQARHAARGPVGDRAGAARAAPWRGDRLAAGQCRCGWRRGATAGAVLVPTRATSRRCAAAPAGAAPSGARLRAARCALRAGTVTGRAAAAAREPRHRTRAHRAEAARPPAARTNRAGTASAALGAVHGCHSSPPRSTCSRPRACPCSLRAHCRRRSITER